jgi:hypothetical protein
MQIIYHPSGSFRPPVPLAPAEEGVRIQVWMTMAAAITLWAEQPGPESERSAIVCLETGSDGLVRTTAQPEVSRIFAEIGIRIDWRRDKQDCAASDGIIVTLSYESPATKYPNAWAYALPYEGTHIVVFYDRVQKTVGWTGARNLLAYVLAHELTHILQGVSRHSQTGIMKAAWDRTDYFDMGRRALHFTPTDVFVLYASLDGRRARLAQKTTGAGK